MQIDAFLSKTLHRFNWKHKPKESMEENKPNPLVSVTEILPPNKKKKKSSLSSKKWESIPAATTEMCVIIWMSKVNFKDKTYFNFWICSLCVYQAILF